ncbi:APC family permease [Glycomyces xiaoerkulensis]|uniref:APC family permease n=1 Tax=Glycomyces xiaoerkulensis TaxID=2038139 RepID=UPI000C260FE3|nr:APC family permease [Glycomyces xiaoerkulensis]
MSTPASRESSTVGDRLAQGRLGTRRVLHFSLTAATPLTVIAGGVPVMYALAGQIGIAVAYLAMALVLGLFAVGYIAMARHITNAGAMYAFVARGLGRLPGVGAAWIAATAYSALQISLYGLLGLQAASLLDRFFSLAVPWWAAALAAWALIALLGTHAVGLNAGVLAVLLVVEIAIVLVFTGSNFLHPVGGSVSFAALDPTRLIGPGTAAGAVLALAYVGYIGFESPTVYAEEARNPRRTVPRATGLTILILALIYVLASWSMPVAAGDERIIGLATADPDIMFTLAGQQLGQTWAAVGQVLLFTSITAAALSFHNTTSRYLFALGREQVLPAWLGRTSPRTLAPAAASLTQSVLALAVIALWAVTGLDPLVHLFYYMGTSAGLALITLVTVCAVAVAVFFWRDRRGESAWTARLAPAGAVAALSGVWYLSTVHFHTLLGVADEALLPRLVQAAILALALLGLAWGLYLKHARPEVYSGIGHGAKAALAQTTAPASAPVGATDAR